MARPRKETVSWFPYFSEPKKEQKEHLRDLEQRFGADGFMWYWKMMGHLASLPNARMASFSPQIRAYLCAQFCIPHRKFMQICAHSIAVGILVEEKGVYHSPWLTKAVQRVFEARENDRERKNKRVFRRKTGGFLPIVNNNISVEEETPSFPVGKLTAKKTEKTSEFSDRKTPKIETEKLTAEKWQKTKKEFHQKIRAAQDKSGFDRAYIDKTEKQFDTLKWKNPRTENLARNMRLFCQWVDSPTLECKAYVVAREIYGKVNDAVMEEMR